MPIRPRPPRPANSANRRRARKTIPNRPARRSSRQSVGHAVLDTVRKLAKKQAAREVSRIDLTKGELGADKRFVLACRLRLPVEIAEIVLSHDDRGNQRQCGPERGTTMSLGHNASPAHERQPQRTTDQHGKEQPGGKMRLQFVCQPGNPHSRCKTGKQPRQPCGPVDGRRARKLRLRPRWTFLGRRGVVRGTHEIILVDASRSGSSLATGRRSVGIKNGRYDHDGHNYLKPDGIR